MSIFFFFKGHQWQHIGCLSWKHFFVEGFMCAVSPFLLSQMPVPFLHWGFMRIFKGKSFGEGWEEVKVGKRSGKELNHLKVSIILTLSLVCHLLSIQCWDSLGLNFPHVQSWNHNRVKLRERCRGPWVTICSVFWALSVCLVISALFVPLLIHILINR